MTSGEVVLQWEMSEPHDDGHSITADQDLVYPLRAQNILYEFLFWGTIHNKCRFLLLFVTLQPAASCCFFVVFIFPGDVLNRSRSRLFMLDSYWFMAVIMVSTWAQFNPPCLTLTMPQSTKSSRGMVTDVPPNVFLSSWWRLWCLGIRDFDFWDKKIVGLFILRPFREQATRIIPSALVLAD